MALALGRFVSAVAAVKAGFDVVGRDVEGASTAVSAVSVSSLLVGRREGLSACLSALTLSLAFPSLAAILEADDDEELLERVKKDRKKRLQRQGVVSSSSAETGLAPLLLSLASD
ncbi:Thylakoid lumenal 16.5 kDa protein, chloroplastic [Apostasia shenzhenica]|uniref:Thylakoid lumenal 16.5 kDa protein, chloroplastic n=1 Tax=Apostasia shenzhenica TaxID=1088818 RepID=A0A2I0B5Y9_9ASPA|nr:Thylakoid lumenal 16.5 kDa protein, chloroplastic [Apostasia shenzhenica]